MAKFMAADFTDAESVLSKHPETEDSPESVDGIEQAQPDTDTSESDSGNLPEGYIPGTYIGEYRPAY